MANCAQFVVFRVVAAFFFGGGGGLCRVRLQGDVRLAGSACLNRGGNTSLRNVGIYSCESFRDPGADQVNLHLNIEARIGQLDEPGDNMDKCHTVIK